jgi:RNA polymerase sigma-70 factor (ECF subfamily)
MSFYPLSNTESEFLGTALADFIADTISSLPDMQRRRFVMHYFDGMTLREIAKLEHCSHVAVSYSVNVAKRTLEENLKKFSS